MKKSPSRRSIDSVLVHGPSQTRSWDFSRHLIAPISSSSTFRLDSLKRGAEGFVQFVEGGPKASADPIMVYDRLDEPNVKMLEEHTALIEHADMAVAFGSGMGAISATLMSLLKAGDRVLAHRNLYGCTFTLLKDWLPRFGIESSFVDLSDQRTWVTALSDPRLRVVYFEAVSNPNLELIDIPALIKVVHSINRKRSVEERIHVVVDNTFATPCSLRPLEHGVDLVIHSLTKAIGGFGTGLGGIVLGSAQYKLGLKLARKDFGSTLSPDAAWDVTVHGLPTLMMRFRKMTASASSIATRLEQHSQVQRVIYPGLQSYPQANLAKKLLRYPTGEFAPGTMMSFRLKGDLKRCERFINHVAKNSYTVTLAVSLGLTKTLIEVPGFMTHAAIPEEERKLAGIDAALIRLSVGIEDADDIFHDLSDAIAATRGKRA